MFSVVHFLDDNTVEAVPSNWLDNANGTCAWPKNTKIAFKLIDKNIDPNGDHFDYYKCKEMSKNIGKYHFKK